MAAQMRGERQLALLDEAIHALEAAGVEVVVLKGLPLGEHLYHDPFLRCSADIDLYVPAAQRDRAATTLGWLGWRSNDGSAPWHESWSIARPEADYHLELHSLLVSDHLAHVAAPSPVALRQLVAGVELPAHAGDFVAPYLAAHLATHQLPPLLWVVDFATLWRSMTEPARSRATAAARAAGLHRYLAWACERSELAARVAEDDWEALGALGIDAMGRRDAHSIWRHLALAATPADRLRLLGAFIVPRRVRGDVAAFARYTLARLRTRLRSLAGVTREYGRPPLGDEDLAPASTPRGIRLERDEMVALTRDVVGAGGALHVRAPGGSMLPTIPRGALVRVGPVPATGIATGDVLLALTSDGEPVVHRAISVRPDGVILRGDAAIVSDPPVPFSRVIGVATHVRVNGVERPIGRRPRRSIGISALKVRRRLARIVRRAR
jgi:hypothetical protein